MQKAPTSGPHGTAAPDIEANGQSFARHLRAGNNSANTIKSYMEAVRQLDAIWPSTGCRGAWRPSTGSMSSPTSRTSSPA